jgi:predicted dehydrogenase
MATLELRFGLIGCGLMGREFASAAARWCHLLDLDVTPRITAICDTNPRLFDWFRRNFPGIELMTEDADLLLGSDAVDAIYCAVPHHLHADLYVRAIEAGKHLLGEKPFGIDQAANDRILDAVSAYPEVLVRCSSEFPFFPGAQRIVDDLHAERFGRIIEVRAGLLHSSDVDPNKPINWKRQIAFNGEYGCMGDLGMHVLHIPLRFGWLPRSVRAVLSNIVTERPGPDGTRVPCETWDNALLLCDVQGEAGDFPMLLETKRISPGDTNTWYLEVTGTDYSAAFSTRLPRTLRTLPYRPGDPQAWHVLDLGYQSAYPTITGPIFEFGFSDALLQMWAAFCEEVVHRDAMRQPFGCVTPEETAQSHRILTAALESQRNSSVVELARMGSR